MRVLNVNMLLDPVSGGGTAERTIQISRAFASSGIETTVLALDSGVTSEVRERLEGVRLELLPSGYRRFHVPLVSMARLRRLVEGVDVVHLSNHWTLLNALVGRAARGCGKPYAVCPAGALPVAGRSLVLKKLYNAVLGRTLVRDASGWVAITDAERADFAGYGVDPSRVAVIPNGVRLEDYRGGDPGGLRRRLGLGERPIVLFLGRLNPIKGPDLLLQAFARVHARHPDHVLVLAGPDEGLRAALERTAAEAGLTQSVVLAGYLGREDKLSALRAARLLAVPSRREAMSLVALEAGACGLPVLMTDQCGFGEAGDAGGAAICAASAESIADALSELLGDPARLARMGPAMNKLVDERYTWGAAVRRYTALFSDITG